MLGVHVNCLKLLAIFNNSDKLPLMCNLYKFKKCYEFGKYMPMRPVTLTALCSKFVDSVITFDYHLDFKKWRNDTLGLGCNGQVGLT